MATLKNVENYLITINGLIKEINLKDNYEEYTRPLSLKIAAASSIINTGNLVRYVNMITESANQIHNATNDAEIQFGFYGVNVGVEMLLEYLNGHWWQYGGSTKQKACATLPIIEELKITS